jgi:hypothetical protein
MVCVSIAATPEQIATVKALGINAFHDEQVAA